MMAVMFVAAMAMCISGCSKDSDNGGNTSGGSTNPPSGGGTSGQTFSLSNTNWSKEYYKDWVRYFGTAGYEQVTVSVHFNDNSNGVLTVKHEFDNASSHNYSDTYRFTCNFSGNTLEETEMVIENAANATFFILSNKRQLQINNFGVSTYGIGGDQYPVYYGDGHLLTKQ